MEPPDYRYLEERIIALDRRLQDWINESRRAIDKAEAALADRLEHMNEFRAQILAERGNFVSHEKFDAHVEKADKAIKALEDFTANLRGRIWSIGVGAAIGTAILSTIVSLAIKYL